MFGYGAEGSDEGDEAPSIMMRLPSSKWSIGIERDSVMVWRRFEFVDSQSVLLNERNLLAVGTNGQVDGRCGNRVLIVVFFVWLC
mmetsp:Transcript_30641/g.63447  ORF Transcript_30641/g.63447 Transcript_30641/m.63447 type:complete len:85 (+) Transcript_30641:1476-1730(+)